MNPFRLTATQPRRPLLRLCLGLIGCCLGYLVLRKVEWGAFQKIVTHLSLRFLVGSLALGFLGISLRSLRLALILGAVHRYGAVWRSVAMGYLGGMVLPLGGGEIVKIASLRAQVQVTGAAAATSTLMDRFLDVFGLGSLLAMLAALGAAMQFRPSVAWALLGAAILSLAAASWLFHWALQTPSGRGISYLRARVRAIHKEILQFRNKFGNPKHALMLIGIQGVIVLVDVTGIWVGLMAFPFGVQLPYLVAMKLGAYLMLGAALPLLPGGLGVHQVASFLALTPAGVDAAGALAFSLVAQATTLIFLLALGLFAGWQSSVGNNLDAQERAPSDSSKADIT